MSGDRELNLILGLTEMAFAGLLLAIGIGLFLAVWNRWGIFKNIP